MAMKKQIILLFVVIIWLLGCGKNGNGLSVTPTPLPEYPSAFRDDFFFMEEEDFPKREEVLAYLRLFFSEHEEDMNSLADTFQKANKNAKQIIYYNTDFSFTNYGESYLFHKYTAITNKSKEGKAFYDFMERNGKIPFQYIGIYPHLSAPMIAFGMKVADMEPKFTIDEVWLVRGAYGDALHIIENPFLYDGCDYEETIHIESLSSGWYLFWTPNI